MDCDYKEIKEYSGYYFLDMGITHYFLSRTGTLFDTIKGLLAENFVSLIIKRRIKETGLSVYSKR